MDIDGKSGKNDNNSNYEIGSEAKTLQRLNTCKPRTWQGSVSRHPQAGLLFAGMRFPSPFDCCVLAHSNLSSECGLGNVHATAAANGLRALYCNRSVARSRDPVHKLLRVTSPV